MKITDSLSDYLIKETILDEEDKNIFKFGINQAIAVLINIITIIIIGVIADKLQIVIVYMAILIPLRTYAGGYHSQSQIICYILSTITVILGLMGVTYIYSSPKICIGVLAISSLIIYLLAPVEAKNKPLDYKEVIVYRRRALTVLWLETLLALLLFKIFAASIKIAIGSVSVMLILGKYLT